HLFLRRFFQRYRGMDRDGIIVRLLGNRAASVRHLAIVYASWFPGSDSDGLVKWLAYRDVQISEEAATGLLRNYQKPFFNVADYGYLLSRHPLEVWVAARSFNNRKSAGKNCSRAAARPQRMPLPGYLKPVIREPRI